jgi:3-methylfumaryl-CoA hydratase
VSVVRRETLALAPVNAFGGTFAPDDGTFTAGSALPLAWEGISFPFDAPLADLRADGTPARDGVVPEIDLPRRMYAGEDTEFAEPIRIGDEVTQTLSLGAVTEKNGSSGRLVFVDVERTYAVGGRTLVRSVWHDVFLDVADPAAPVREPRRDPDAASADWVASLTLDARQLFRFSALTFNTHLVHYDRAWAREREGLDDLLVHGPLLRILMADAVRRRHPERRAARLSVRLMSPAYVDRPIRIVGREDEGATRASALGEGDAILATAQVDWV